MIGLVSVIITTKNEEKNIGICLLSISRQSYKNIELIVVDNTSTDRTKQIALAYTNKVFDKGPERSAQRNFGAKKAKGKYLLFLDADMELSPTVIEECVNVMGHKTMSRGQNMRHRTMSRGQNMRHRTMSRGQTEDSAHCSLLIAHCPIALIIPEKSIGSGFWTKCKILERMCYEGVDWMEAARFYDKAAFEALGGFDENLTGPEDFDLSQRVGGQFGKLSIGRINSYIYHDEGVIQLSCLLSKKYYYGKKMARYMKKNQNSESFAKQANPFFRYVLFFRKPRLLLSDPIHAVGLLFMKTLELAALALGATAGRL